MLKEIRISQIISSRTKYSRRQAEKLIEEGRVRLNGEPVLVQGVKSNIEANIEIDNIEIPEIKPLQVVKFNKPRGCICSRSDESGRKTIYDFLPKRLQSYISVGRLDYNSEGLLLLTNYGIFAKEMENPDNNLKRVYKVRCFGSFNPSMIEKVKNGITVDGIKYKGMDIEVIDEKLNNIWLQISIYEGKNREIRKVLLNFGLQVSRLIRISYGDFHLKYIKTRDFEDINHKHIKELRNYFNEGSYR